MAVQLRLQASQSTEANSEAFRTQTLHLELQTESQVRSSDLGCLTLLVQISLFVQVK